MNNPSLYCIDVDNPSWSNANWINIDHWTSFSTNCFIALGCTDSTACNYDPLATISDSSCVYPTSSSSLITVCYLYTWNGVTYTTSGVYDTTLTNCCRL